MQVREILKQLNLGNSVAEEDNDLESYFVETDTFRLLIADERDIIAGDKGTGKTALYKILVSRFNAIPALEKTEIVTAFNPTGNSVFQTLARGEVLNEGQYITVWKVYVLSLAGNWLLQIYENQWTPSMRKLDKLLRDMSLRTADDAPKTVFAKVIERIERLTRPNKAAIEFKFNEAGMPTGISPSLEFSDKSSSSGGESIQIIRHSDSLALLNNALEEADISTWLVLDRLDEAFQGYPDTEIPALRALFRTYLDLKEFSRIRLKLFVRQDLFRKITKGEQGFVNLTHINARKVEIIWDDEDLLILLIRRIRANKEFIKTLGLEEKTPLEIFYALFPNQVDPGTRRPETWKWILARIRDGNSVIPPRNLIDLVKKAQEEQNRQENRESREFEGQTTLITSDAIKKALARLSEERVQDTLLAESGKYSQYIDRFRDGKAEHNLETITETLNVPPENVKGIIKVLLEIGFLEQIRDTYKIPMLYRDGLSVTKGKAFLVEGDSPDEDVE